jgi:hypothetical protein
MPLTLLCLAPRGGSTRSVSCNPGGRPLRQCVGITLSWQRKDYEIPGSTDRNPDPLGHRYCSIWDAQAADHRRRPSFPSRRERADPVGPRSTAVRPSETTQISVSASGLRDWQCGRKCDHLNARQTPVSITRVPPTGPPCCGCEEMHQQHPISVRTLPAISLTNTIEAESLGFHSTFAVKTPFHRVRLAVGNTQPAEPPSSVQSVLS